MNSISPETQEIVVIIKKLLFLTLCPEFENSLTLEIENILKKAKKPMRDVLESIINGSLHPKIAVRRTLVDLKPIREVLKKE